MHSINKVVSFYPCLLELQCNNPSTFYEELWAIVKYFSIPRWNSDLKEMKSQVRWPEVQLYAVIGFGSQNRRAARNVLPGCCRVRGILKEATGDNSIVDLVNSDKGVWEPDATVKWKPAQVWKPLQTGLGLSGQPRICLWGYWKATCVSVTRSHPLSPLSNISCQVPVQVWCWERHFIKRF